MRIMGILYALNRKKQDTSSIMIQQMALVSCGGNIQSDFETLRPMGCNEYSGTEVGCALDSLNSAEPKYGDVSVSNIGEWKYITCCK